MKTPYLGLLPAIAATRLWAGTADRLGDIQSDFFQSNHQIEGEPLSLDFIPRFVQELPDRSTYVVNDRFGPQSYFNWVRLGWRQGYGIHESIINEGRNTATSIMSDSARESALAVFPVQYWQEWWQDFGLHLLEGVIGNTVEQRAGGIRATYSEADEFWAESGKDKVLSYGARPFNQAPYLYGRINLGHNYGRPAMSIDARVSYDIFRADKVELRTALPVGQHSTLAAGIEVYPSRWGDRNEHFLNAGARISHVVRQGAHHLLAFIGVSTTSVGQTRGETLVLAGFSREW